LNLVSAKGFLDGVENRIMEILYYLPKRWAVETIFALAVNGLGRGENST
jgi:hypothetical protein